MDQITQLLQRVAHQAGHTLTPGLQQEINAALARPAAEPVTTEPAMVGHVKFGPGIQHSSIVNAAIRLRRYHDEQQQESQQAPFYVVWDTTREDRERKHVFTTLDAAKSFASRCSYSGRAAITATQARSPIPLTDAAIVATLERHGVRIEFGTEHPVTAQVGDLLTAVRELLGQPIQVETTGEAA
ncbi:hypothetical protein [Microbulbifer sp. JSM ZJ756]|uniref:hypothetical protein n=1 Tax=Microbulbifer sp. JSM ZJ756 TaxID=3376191 RepID=UPI0037B002AF